MSKGKFVLGAAIGAAAGVVAGLLTAPKSGKETRADLKKKARELKQDATTKGDELRAKGEKAYYDARDAARDLHDRSGRALRSARDEFAKDKK
ncbi:MAG: YtxH domain-containing protein [Candidatus Nanosynbacter sp.]|jgi:hypothetical protein|nr:YtxH domain-containing protein [Candidatus Nanosynbacter sp.]